MARSLLRRNPAYAVVALMFAIEVVIRYGSHLDPAVAWYLYAGGRLLDGATLYVEVFEINPPLGLWLCTAIVAVARALAADPIIVLKTVFFLLTAASLLISLRLLAAATDVSAATRNLLLVLLAALMLFLPGAEFGQRDHLAIIVLTPWVLLRWNRLIGQNVSWPLAVAIGAGASVGMWLKPHFFFVLISVEVTMLFATRTGRTILRFETLMPIACGIVYMALIRTTWSATLLTTVALYGSRAFIPIYGVPFETIAGRLVLPLLLGAVAVASGRLLSERLLALRTLLFVAGATLVCAFVLQSGEAYQSIPALNFLALAAGLGLVRWLAGDVHLEAPFHGLVIAGAGAAILAILVGAWSNQVVPYRGHGFADAIAAEGPDARVVLIASTDVADAFPLINETGLVWASRFPSLWLSPYVATKLDDEGGPNDDIARFMLKANVDDLIEYEPGIVFIDEAAERPWYRGKPLDYLDFWDKDGRFFAFWKRYERRGDVGDFAVYVRTAPPGAALEAPDIDRADPFGCILADVVDSYC